MNQFFTANEFRERRKKIQELAGSSAWILLQSGPPVKGFTVFRQSNEFYYLTGLESPQSLLLIGGGRSTLFLPANGASSAEEGGAYGLDEAEQIKITTGVDDVLPSDRLKDYLPANSIRIFLPHSPAEGRHVCQDTLRHALKLTLDDEWERAIAREALLIERVRALRPKVDVQDLSPLLNQLRIVKSKSEIAVMKETGALSAGAVAEAIRSTEPGVFEYQLAAIADYYFRVNGASGEGYRPIVASGKNIWHAHYYRNDCELVAGELVLMDYAPDLANYTNDIGRIWPVNGKFSPVQRELYGFVVRYHQELLKRIRPGVLPEQIHDEASTVMAKVVEETRFSKAIYKEAATAMLGFSGHLSHPVGMAVHDVGTYFGRPLEPGIVFSVDPQMWVRSEQLYVRVEDTVVVTESGVDVLTGAVPTDMDEIEKLMREPGMLQRYPPKKGLYDVATRA